ncbi:hypothetical protein NA63_2738 [Flavobacteriaceae bacterium MAR_2010_105]|nr:hypothetical protein NA63_2738 [Flavobacteriaceae bacterium MAR_2010_105]
MIKFFRRIRQNLLLQGKTGKYLTYAIGEIVLVVIGILIALQINNWNELRLIKDQEKVLLKEIISDLNLNENNAQFTINKDYGIGRDSILKTFVHVINHLENKLPYTDDLPKYFHVLHQVSSLEIKTSGFESLKASGMDIIQKDGLRSAIGEYYTVTVNSTQKANNELRDDFYNYILKFPRTIFITKRDEANKTDIQIPINYKQLLENIEYIESLKMYSSIYDMDLNATKDYLNKTRLLKEKINTYLNGV